MIGKLVRLMFCILFAIIILAACTKTTEIVPLPPHPTDTQVPATKTPLKPTATQVPATKTLLPPTDAPVIPTQTLEPFPTASSINELPMTERVSVASDGAQGNSDSYAPSISADGRYIVFASDATNLVEGDTNGETDIFVHDRKTGETQRVSVASDGTQGNGNNTFIASSISADGRYVVFSSSADNLVDGDTNGVQDCFVHDRVTGYTIRVSVASDGTQANGACAHIGLWGIFYGPSISADGRYVAFSSDATNLLEGVTHGGFFVHDRVTGKTTYERSGGSPSISADGRYVAFSNGGIYVHDRVTGETTLESVSSNGTQGNQGGNYPVISADGRYVAFSSISDNLVQGDTSFLDIFVHNRVTGETTLASVSSDGIQGKGNNEPFGMSISADGRYVAFFSLADNLVEGDTNRGMDIYVHDRVTGDTIRVSVASDGTQGNHDSYWSSISADGRYVAFYSLANNLVEGDTNGVSDIFVRDLGTSK